MKIEREFMYPDYNKIREESHRIDCTIVKDDFNTNHPNPNRIDAYAYDIGRYLNYKNKKGREAL